MLRLCLSIKWWRSRSQQMKMAAIVGVLGIGFTFLFNVAAQAKSPPVIAPIDLGTLGGTFTAALAMNEKGQVVGYGDIAGGAEPAFSWTQATGMIDIGTLGGTFSAAIAVNNRGQVVG